MSYACQRLSHRDRPLERARAIRMRLGGSASLMDPFPEKPSRMRWATFDRLKAKAEVADAAHLAMQAAWLDAIRPGWRSGSKAA